MDAVKMFFEIQQSIKYDPRDSNLRHGTADPHNEAARKALRRAKLIELPAEVYLNFYDGALSHVDAHAGTQESGDIDRLVSITKELSAQASADTQEKLPFDSVFFSFGNGISLNQLMVRARLSTGYSALSSIEASENVDYKLLGFLCVRNVAVIEFAYVDVYSKRTSYLRHGPSWMAGKSPQGPIVRPAAYTKDIPVLERWRYPLTFDGLVVPQIVDYVNEHRTITQQPSNSLSYRRAAKKAAKQHGFKKAIPPRYYKIELATNIVHQIIRKHSEVPKGTPRNSSCRQFQGDVRQHERVLFRRGQLPLSAQDKLQLEKLKYRIYETQPLNADDARRLAVRTIAPKSATEWIAIKHAMIKEHKSPSDATARDKNLEYRPALRVVGATPKIVESVQYVEEVRK